MPLERATAEPVNTSALAARGSLVAAPEVVINGVRALDLVVPLTAEVGALGEIRGWSGCGESSSAGQSNECGELHVDHDVWNEEGCAVAVRHLMG